MCRSLKSSLTGKSATWSPTVPGTRSKGPLSHQGKGPLPLPQAGTPTGTVYNIALLNTYCTHNIFPLPTITYLMTLLLILQLSPGSNPGRGVPLQACVSEGSVCVSVS